LTTVAASATVDEHASGQKVGRDGGSIGRLTHGRNTQ